MLSLKEYRVQKGAATAGVGSARESRVITTEYACDLWADSYAVWKSGRYAKSEQTLQNTNPPESFVQAISPCGLGWGVSLQYKLNRAYSF